MKTAAIIASVLLAAVSLAHAARVLAGADITVQASGHTIQVPMWVSVPAFVVAGGLAIWLWLEANEAPADG